MAPKTKPAVSGPSEAHGRCLVLMGQGYVGLSVAMQAVARGHAVVGFDPDEERVKLLNTAESYVEDVSDAVLQQAVDSGRFRATTRERDCSGSDEAVINVPTPLREGMPDLSYIEPSTRTLGRNLRLPTRGRYAWRPSERWPTTAALHCSSSRRASRTAHPGRADQRPRRAQ